MREFKWWFHLPLIGGMAKRKIEESEKVRELVGRTTKILALTEMLDQFPRTLSGGQRQRVALGRAMVRQPEVFLMDEPLSNLDAKLRMSMRAEIIKLHRDVGGTFVYVTHDQIEAMTMGTKIALMRDGVVQQFGTPREIYMDPTNTFVARFIGAPPMNLIDARIEGGSLRIGDGTFALPSHLAGFSSDQPKVLVGIRPNAMTVVSGGEGTLAGKVALVEHVGAESVIDVRLDNATTAHREEGEGRNEVKFTESGYSDLRANDNVRVKLDLTESVLFSPDSGLRLRPEPRGAARHLAS
jgi:multiple sugar transport system ATP-binding protein